MNRSKLASNTSIDFPVGLNDAIAKITKDFSFAYLKEAFITSLLVIVSVRRGTNKEFEYPPVETNGTPNGSDPRLESNLLFRVFSRQIQILRHEMEGSRKSAEDAAKSKAPVVPQVRMFGGPDMDMDTYVPGKISGNRNDALWGLTLRSQRG